MANRIFDLIGWLGGALVVAALAIRFGMPAQMQYATYLSWAGLACLGIYVLGHWRDVVGAFSQRRTRYATMSITSIAIMLGILVAANYIGKQQVKRWDLTAGQQFSLSDQSKNVLAKLDSPMQILVFATEQQFPEYRDRLREYEYGSKFVTTEYIDPDKQMTIAQQNEVQQYGTILFKYKGRTERTTDNLEQNITNAIIKVVAGMVKKVYFTAGHGEKDLTSQQRDGYNVINDAFKLENYTVEQLVLAQAPSVPDDASVVVIAGPRTDFFPAEIDALKAYMEKNGKLFLMLDPPEKPGERTYPNLLALVHEWGIDVNNDIVVDTSGMGTLIGTDESVPVVAQYPPHAITDRFTMLTAYPLARSVTPTSEMPRGGIVQTFLQSGPQSWAETDLNRLMTAGEVAYDEGSADKKGPISIGVAASISEMKPTPGADPSAPLPEKRIAVIGDSDFASNAAIGIAGNRDLFLNTVGWLSQQENLISIRPREAADRRITLTATQQYNMWLISLVVIPVGIFGTGIYTWWRRR